MHNEFFKQNSLYSFWQTRLKCSDCFHPMTIIDLTNYSKILGLNVKLEPVLIIRGLKLVWISTSISILIFSEGYIQEVHTFGIDLTAPHPLHRQPRVQWLPSPTTSYQYLLLSRPPLDLSLHPLQPLFCFGPLTQTERHTSKRQ